MATTTINQLKDAPLIVPFIFAPLSAPSALRDESPKPTPYPTATVSWDFSDPKGKQRASDPHPERSLARVEGRGIAIGRSDGSICLLLASSLRKPPPSLRPPPHFPPIPTLSSPPPSQPSSLQQAPLFQPKRPSATAHSSTSSIHSITSVHAPSSTFSPKSRFVSGLTPAQAAAPTVVMSDETVNERKDELREMLVSGRTSTAGGSEDHLPAPRKVSISSVTGPGAGDREFVRLARPPVHSSPRLSISTPKVSSDHPDVNDAPANAASTSTRRDDDDLKFGSPTLVLPPLIGERFSVSALAVVEARGWLISLQTGGSLSIFSLADGMCLSTRRLPQEVGSVWKNLAIAEDTETLTAIVCTSPATPDEDDGKSEDSSALKARSKILVVDLDSLESVPCSWEGTGGVEAMSVSTRTPETLELCLISSLAPYFATLPIQLPSAFHTSHHAASTIETSPSQSTSEEVTAKITHLFARKGNGAESSRTSLDVSMALSRVIFGDRIDHAWDGAGIGLVKGLAKLDRRFIIWGTGGVVILEVENTKAKICARLELPDLVDAELAGEMIVLRTSDAVVRYRLVSTGSDGESGNFRLLSFESMQTITAPLIQHSRVLTLSGSSLVVDGTEQGISVGLASSSNAELSCLASVPATQQRSVTVLLPAGEDALDSVLVGKDDGHVVRVSLSNLLTTSLPASPTNLQGMNASITCIIRAQNVNTGSKHVVAGTADGSVGVWDAESLALQAGWTMFTTSVVAIFLLHEREAGRLRGCLLCVAEDGTVGFVILDGLEQHYLIPGTRAPLVKICIGEDSILLMYEHGNARLWDLRTQELRRSMSVATAENLASKNGWMEILIEPRLTQILDVTMSGLPELVTFNSPTAALTILCDIRSLDSLVTPEPKLRIPTSDALRIDPAQVEDPTSTPRAARLLKPLGPLLSALLSWGLDAEIDQRCISGLGLTPPSPGIVVIGLRGAEGSIAVPGETERSKAWTISPMHTGVRLLALASLLQMYLSVETLESAAGEVISFYATRLQETVGSSFQQPLLSFYAEYWLHSSPEIQQAARVLFGSLLADTSDDKISEIVQQWQHELPACKPESQRNSEIAARALVLVGQIAVENHSLFSPALLKDVSNSITSYLHDVNSPYRLLAVDLCSSGFQIWQHYIDAMEILRSLFQLAMQKTLPTALAARARTATLQIASSNTPLFMTTLSYDILNANSPAQRNATMKLVAFMAKRRPLVLYASLARIAEAIVKSLDPNASAARDAVQQTATVILESLVSTFPSIDFHGGSQRLAVGTLEGAVIIYDLKTATRLFVLDGHKHKITACSFSPDGRRVVTVALEESKVVIWKVGMSFTSLFKVGTPPRQGGPTGRAGEPYKQFDFAIGDEGNMTTAASLEWVRFEWPGERTARLRIRETALTFAT